MKKMEITYKFVDNDFDLVRLLEVEHTLLDPHEHKSIVIDLIMIR